MPLALLLFTAPFLNGLLLVLLFYFLGSFLRFCSFDFLFVLFSLSFFAFYILGRLFSIYPNLLLLKRRITFTIVIVVVVNIIIVVVVVVVVAVVVSPRG